MSLSDRLRSLETNEYALVIATNGAPAAFAGEGTLAWDYTNDDLYVNSDGLNSWQLIGGGGGPGFPHAILSATHTDALAAGVVDGDVMIGNVTPAWSRLGIAVPGANVRNVLGVDNAELRPSWKTALDANNPTAITIGAAAAPGTSLVFAHRDHTHASPATWTATAHNVLDSTYHGDVLTGAVARGDLLYGNATPKIARLALGGIAGSIVTRDATDVLWSGYALSGTAGQAYTFPAASASIPGGSGAANQVAYWSGANALTGDAAFTVTQATPQLALTGAAPTVVLTDNTALAKSLTIAVDANAANLRESAGAAGSLLVLDLANNRVGIGTAPAVSLEVAGVIRGTQFTFQTDTDTYMSLYGANRFQIVTGGVVGLQVDVNQYVRIPKRLMVASTLLWADSVTLAVGIGTDSPQRLLHAQYNLTSSAAVAYAARLTRYNSTAGALAAGDGVGLEFELETATSGTNQVAATIAALWNDPANATFKGDLVAHAIDSAGAREIWRGRGTGAAAALSFYGGTPVVRGAALTAQLTTITHTAPGAPDYAVQDMVDVSLGAGWAFANHDEANTVLSVIANLQVRVAELEARLNAATGVNLIA